MLFAILSLPSIVGACTCGEISPCQAHAGATVVFSGQVLETKSKQAKSNLPSNAVSTTLTSGRLVTRFKVEEGFAGINGPEIEVVGEGTTCDFLFKQGERYVVYAYRNTRDSSLQTNICSGTKELSQAKDDLVYLRALGKSPAGATVFGDVSREVDVTGVSGVSIEPIKNAEIIFENGNQRFQAVSGDDGKFELSGIPGGHYLVRTDPPTNYSNADVGAERPQTRWELDVPEHGCFQAWFTARFAGEISGTVTDTSSTNPTNLSLKLISVDAISKDSFSRGARLEQTSSFTFNFLPPGRYYLGFNLNSGPFLEAPYPEYYYPGVEDRSKATIITITEGQTISGLTLPMPLRRAERMLQGVAVWPDGKPFVDRCGIQLVNPRTGYREGNCVETDSQGRFTIKGVEGQTYELSATIPGRESYGLVDSKPVIVKIEKVNNPVKLVVKLP